MESFDVGDDAESIDSIEYGLGEAPSVVQNKQLENVSVVALVGCHIADAGGLELLRACWQSITDQRDKPDQVTISVSAAVGFDSQLTLAREEILGQAGMLGMCTSVVVRGAVELSALAHFSCAIEDITRGASAPSPRDIWVILCGGNGLWHPSRTAVYRKCASSSTYACSLLAPLRCRMANIEVLQPKRVDEIERLLSQGDILLEGNQRVPDSLDYAIRLDILSEFFKRVPPPLVSIRYGDMALVYFLESQGCDNLVKITTGPSWMYFNQETTQACNSKDTAHDEKPGRIHVAKSMGARTTIQPLVLPRDRLRAEEQLAEVAHMSPGVALEDFAVVVAQCREWMEAVCVSMWIGGPYTHQQLQLLARSVLKAALPPVPREWGGEALSDWSLEEVKKRLVSTGEELGLIYNDEVSAT